MTDCTTIYNKKNIYIYRFKTYVHKKNLRLKKRNINQAKAWNILKNISLRNYHVSPASSFSISKSFLVPLKQTRAVRRMEKEIFVLIHVIVVAWSSSFFEEMSSASLEWYRWHSWDIPPVVVKTKGVNVPVGSLTP